MSVCVRACVCVSVCEREREQLVMAQPERCCCERVRGCVCVRACVCVCAQAAVVVAAQGVPESE